MNNAENRFLDDSDRNKQIYAGPNITDESIRALIAYAPVAMAVFRGKDFIVDFVNEKVLEAWGKAHDEVLNKPLFEAKPELAGQGLEEIFDHIYTTGEKFTANEFPVKFFRDSRPVVDYRHLLYEPLRDNNGEIYAIASIGIDVTDQVRARQKVEEAEERARLAVEATDIGTIDINLVENTAIASQRFTDIAGVSNDGGYQSFLTKLHPEDRSIRDEAFKNALLYGKLFYEARIFTDNGIRWIRGMGQTYYNEDGSPVRMLGTIADITDQRLLQQQKDEFISLASHELKTPLTSLKAYIQLLQRAKEGQRIPREFVDNSIKQIGRLEKLIADLLDVSKISSGKLTYNMETIDFSILLREAIRSLQLTVPSHWFVLQGNPAVMLKGDRYRLEQVLSNYLMNAVKYSPNSNNVVINSEIDGDKLIVSVQDFGIGISPEHLHSLFDRFYRIESSSRSFEGLGLGLYVSSEIIKRHHGDFWIKSEPDKGSTFYFSLPIEPGLNTVL
jgi:PAS domain S-box-containing protein